MSLPVYNNIILISGSDRNVGKTFFACELIRKFRHLPLVGIKISPHWHEIDHPENILIQNEYFLILHETIADGRKDSSKMLNSGAERVYYLQSDDEHLKTAFDYLNDHYIKGKPAVCESAALSKFITPAAHLRITEHTEKGKIDIILNRIFIMKNHWSYTNLTKI